MKKTILSLFAALFALGLSLPTQAAGVTTGTLTAVYTMNTSLCSPCSAGSVLVLPSGASTGQPSCATSLHSYAIDGTTATGKIIANALIMAKTTGQSITIYGDGTCSVWFDRETISYVILN